LSKCDKECKLKVDRSSLIYYFCNKALIEREKKEKQSGERNRARVRGQQKQKQRGKGKKLRRDI
jgi:hypothetical protein